MKYCRDCGWVLPQDAAYCPKCGAPTTIADDPDAPARAAVAAGAAKARRRRPIVRRWFWALALVVALAALRLGGRGAPGARQAEPAATSAPTAAPTAVPTPEPTETPAPTPTPGPTALPESAIRPEVREFLDSYEACMDEYVDFMRRYMSADPGSMMAMMGDYYDMLERYAQFTNKLDALDESQLTDAELKYYLEVTSRVSQKLLSVMDA